MFEPACLPYNRAVDLRAANRLDEAIEAFRQAIDMKPDYADAHVGLGMTLLSRGDLEAGFEALEWRWLTWQMSGLYSQPDSPRWHGEPGDGHRLLVQSEQGFGDTIQFCRYLPMVAARNWHVVMPVLPPLLRLMRQSFPTVDVVAEDGPAPDCDAYCPLMSLPLVFGTSLETIPANVPYLHANPAQVEAWRSRLAAFKRLKVGLCWAGSDIDRRRSIAPEMLSDLAAWSGCHFFSLQKERPAAPARLGLVDHVTEMSDFADTAALITNLDLIISVDTAVAHLAGALGKPTWLLAKKDACWRWLLGRWDSPWYPTMRIYRQTRPGDWASVLTDVVNDLQHRAFLPAHRLDEAALVAADAG